MNGVERLLDYYNKLTKDFHRYYVDVLENYGEETVHDLRVTMKKMVAFFQLMEILDGSFSSGKAMEAFQQLYKKAGKVRNFQVEKKLVYQEEERLKLEHDFSEWLAEQERKKSANLKEYEGKEHSMVPVRRLESLVQSRIRFLQAEKLEEGFIRYFDQLIGQIKTVVHEELGSEEKLHLLRKHVKELFYNLKLAGDLCTRKKVRKAELKKLDTLQNLLGKWHDHDFTLLKIEAGQRDCPPKLKRQILKDKERYAKRIFARLGTLPGILEIVENRLKEMLHLESLAIRKAKKTPPAPPSHSSFNQKNVGEGIK